MNQCMRITFIAEGGKESLHSFVRRQAKEFSLEGVVQPFTDDKVRVIVCGPRDNVEDFIDTLYSGANEKMLDNLRVEPIMKDRDYRGVFRVIE